MGVRLKSYSTFLTLSIMHGIQQLKAQSVQDERFVLISYPLHNLALVTIDERSNETHQWNSARICSRMSHVIRTWSHTKSLNPGFVFIISTDAKPWMTSRGISWSSDHRPVNKGGNHDKEAKNNPRNWSAAYRSVLIRSLTQLERGRRGHQRGSYIVSEMPQLIRVSNPKASNRTSPEECPGAYADNLPLNHSNSFKYCKRIIQHIKKIFIRVETRNWVNKQTLTTT